MQVHGALTGALYPARFASAQPRTFGRGPRLIPVDPLLMITNAEAGTSDELAVEAALSVLREAADVEVAATGNPGELDGVLQRAGSRTIVVAGGDGSLHAVVSALSRRNELGRSTLALLPLGTGNDFARTLQIPLHPEEAARAILAGRPRKVDVLVDELGGVVVNNVHVGASAQASRRSAIWKERLGKFKIGILGYPVGAMLAAVKPPFIRLRVEVDGEVVADMDRHILMVAVGNGASVGGGNEVTPDADPRDGKLDVMISFSTGPLARFGFVWQMRQGEQRQRDDVAYHRGTTVSVSGEDFWLAADGEISGPETRRTWRLQQAAFSMILPA